MAKQYSAPPALSIDPAKSYAATLDTSEGPISVEFFPSDAPQHVNSFIFLARDGYYDGVIFHRVIPGFMVQGGDPTGTGGGGPGYKLKAEFNSRKHTRGVLSAARTNDPNSAGSQFFIVHQDSPHLDRQYTVFGRVTSGLETLDKIAAIPTDHNDRPKKPVTINKITIADSSQ